MARVKHPNAVTVHAARISRDVAYIEMEYVSGKSLDQILQKGVPMPLTGSPASSPSSATSSRRRTTTRSSIAT